MAGIGWISIHRKIQECSIWIDDEPFDRRSAWIDLLLLANHEDKKMIFDGNIITVQRGQRVTSVRYLAERWRWSTKKTLNFLRLLESEQMIVKESDNKKTLLTIVNYGVYQSDGNAEETQRKQSGNAEETQRKHSLPTNNNDNNDNNVNNDNNDNNISPPKRSKPEKHTYGEYNHVRLTDNEYQKLCTEYGEIETGKAIRFLDEYIEMKGYKAQSHYLCIRKWVFDALKRETPNTNQTIKGRWANVQ